MRVRKQNAVILASRLPELISPLGTLLIEGYNTDFDWFSLDDFLPVFSKLSKGQVHLFSIGRYTVKDPDLQKFIEGEIVQVNEDSLATFLKNNVEKGKIKVGLSPHDKGGSNSIRVNKILHHIPSDIWKSASRSARILDDSITDKVLEFSSEDAKYFEYRNFLSSSGVEPK